LEEMDAAEAEAAAVEEIMELSAEGNETEGEHGLA
jgi:hypothetical protein